MTDTDHAYCRYCGHDCHGDRAYGMDLLGRFYCRRWFCVRSRPIRDWVKIYRRKAANRVRDLANLIDT